MRVSLPFCRLAGVAIALAMWAASAGAVQAPPPEMNRYVLIDTGPAHVPAPCSCISSPFTVPTQRPGWGFGDGPAAPTGNAAPSRAARQRQSELDAEDRANLPVRVDDAFAGNPNASVSVGYDLTVGRVVRRNDEEAARWFHLAASQGHPDAFIQLGYRYSHGIGVPQNDETAAYWYRAGADHGDKGAMVALGLIYAAGRGVRQDWSAAVRWWQRAGDVGLASRFLGDAYACGLGVEQDNQRAVSAYRRSVETGELSSSVQLGHMYRSACAAASDETMFGAYRKAADQGDPEAQVALSDLFFQGRGTDQSFYYAYMWARLAERRLPAGTLRTSAHARVAQAARLLSAVEIKDVESFVESVLISGATPMR